MGIALVVLHEDPFYDSSQSDPIRAIEKAETPENIRPYHKDFDYKE